MVVKRQTVEHRRRSFLIVQIHLQCIDGSPINRVEYFLRSIGQHHLQARMINRQLEPALTGCQNLRIQFDRQSAGHAQLLQAKLGQRPGTQAKLHGAPVSH